MSTASPAQRRTLPARQAFKQQFESEQERSEFYRRIGAKGNEGRVTLSREEARALLDTLAIMQGIAPRARQACGEAVSS